MLKLTQDQIDLINEAREKLREAQCLSNDDAIYGTFDDILNAIEEVAREE